MAQVGLDPSEGLKLWTAEIFGDWYRDPWGWPERKWLQSNINDVSILDFYDHKSRVLKYDPVFHCIDVPKSHLGVRPAVIQDPLSRFLYLTASAAAMKSLHSDMPDFVFGWRMRESVNEGRGPVAAHNDDEWANYLEHVRSGVSALGGLQADITSFFASINPVDLETLLADLLGGGSAPYAVMKHVIDSHNKIARRSGLPQRSFASAALANFFLRPIDDALSFHLKSGRIDRAARWMDDIVAFGPPENLYALYLDIQEKARMIGLEVNSSKGRLGNAKEVVEAIDLEQIQDVTVKWKVLHSDYTDDDDDVNDEDGIDLEDIETLIELESTALQLGASASRPWLRAALASLRKSENFDRATEWQDNARNIPHAADVLGRYLRACAEDSLQIDIVNERGNIWLVSPWEKLCAWLVDHLKSKWCEVDWVKAQLALAVPSSKCSPELVDLLRDWFRNSTNVQLLAVAGQRLAVLDPDYCCEVVRARVDHVSDALLDRVFGLSLLATRKDRVLSEKIIRRGPSNRLLVEYFDSTGWKPAKVERDFDPA